MFARLNTNNFLIKERTVMEEIEETPKQLMEKIMETLEANAPADFKFIVEEDDGDYFIFGPLGSFGIWIPTKEHHNERKAIFLISLLCDPAMAIAFNHMVGLYLPEIVELVPVPFCEGLNSGLFFGEDAYTEYEAIKLSKIEEAVKAVNFSTLVDKNGRVLSQ